MNTGQFDLKQSCSGKLKFHAFYLILFSFFLNGCASPSKSGTRPAKIKPASAMTVKGLVGTRFNVTEVSAKRVNTASALWILFDKSGRISGSTGCNLIQGTYVSNGYATLKIKAALTRKACPNSLAREATLLNALDQVRSYQIVNSKQLILINNSGTIVLIAVPTYF